MTAQDALPLADARPSVRLDSGNPYRILGRCCDAAEKAGWLLKEWRAFRKEATRGDYETLLAVVRQRFQVSVTASFSPDPDDWRNGHGSAPDTDE